VGARIAALRSACGMSGERLGALLGLTKSQVSKIENGTRKLDVSEVALVADALGVTLAEVLGVARKGSLALAARVMSEPDQAETLPARRRVRQALEVEAALADAVGLMPARPSAAGADLMAKVRAVAVPANASSVHGAQLADTVRDALGLGRAPIADLATLCERHFSLSVLLWPIGKTVSGLCAHGDGVALSLVSTSFPPGHQRFTLDDPREVIIESDLFAVGTPAEKRANAFAAVLLMPADGLREIIADRKINALVLAELMREFRVSYRALLFRLADRSVRLLTPESRDVWLDRTVTSVLREAGDADPAELTFPDQSMRVPARLWQAAQHGYESGRVGIGVLSALLDEDAEDLFMRLATEGVCPPIMRDNLDDL
jgi:transcriptional regulator with XRE-family HTH domain